MAPGDDWYPLPTLEDVLNDASGRLVVALDFDGVVNCDRPKWPDKPRKKHVRTSVGEYLITWSPSLRDELKALAQHPHVQIVWLTSWGPEIGAVEDLLGLPVFPRGIDTLLSSATVPAVKHAAIAEIAATGRPYIWCDDEEAGDTGEATEFGPRLEIRPKSKHGLTPDDLERMWDFVHSTIADRHLTDERQVGKDEVHEAS